MSTLMKDGSRVEDPRLGRLVHFDERSRAYKAVEQPRAQGGPRSYTWNMRPGVLGYTKAVNGLWIDQGGEGSCVGHGVIHEAACPPRIVRGLDNLTAMEVYHIAQHDDPWAGCYLGPRCPLAPSSDRYDGTATLSGVKVGVQKGWYSGYHWAFGEEELWAVIGRWGPAIIGIPWFEGMYSTNRHGYLEPTGRFVGYHCLVINGQNIRRQDYGGLNSWDTFGPFRISRPHMDFLLRRNGEACLPDRL